jgi:hypothetical protein
VPTDLAGVPRLAGEEDEPGEPAWDLFSAAAYILAAGTTEPVENAASQPGTAAS